MVQEPIEESSGPPSRNLTLRAGAILREAGLGATHQVLLRVETTLAGAAGDPELRPALRQGRLEHEIAARGFDIFAGEKLPPRHPPAEASAATGRRPPATVPPTPSPAADRDQERDKARLAAAREAVARAEARASQLREQLDSARKRVEELSGMLRDAGQREAEATREEKRAADALRAARDALGAAEGNRRPLR